MSYSAKPSWIFRFILIALAFVAWSTGSLCAAPVRQTPPEENRGVATPNVRPIQESRFRVVFPGLDGTAQVILPSASFKDLEKYLSQEPQQTSAPAFSIHKIEAKGNVTGNIANIRFEFLLTTRGDALVNVPIDLKEGISLLSDSANTPQSKPNDKKTQQFEYKGEGKCELTVDSGYILWIQNPQSQDQKNPPNHTHQVAFSLAFPISYLGDEEQRLKISFPQSLSSRLVLSVPLSNAVPTDPQGTAIVHSVKPLQPKGTEFEIQGISKTLNLSWREHIQTAQQEKPAVLHVEDAQIIVRMNYRETEFNATLPVRSVGGPLQRFTIHLPPGTKYIPDPQFLQTTKDYQIREKAPSTDPAAEVPSDTSATSILPAAALEVIVSDPTKADSIIPVSIKAVRSFDPEESDVAWSELGGFKVEGAEQQSGYLKIQVPGDLKLNLKNLHGIREDDTISDLSVEETSMQGETTARFVYYTQPFSLQARAVYPKTQVVVKPEYRIVLERGQILLTGQISAVVNGSKTAQLEWNFYDWQLDNVGPSSIVDYAGVVQEPEDGKEKKGTTTIPLRVRSDGTIELTFSASLSMPPIIDNRTTIEFPIPMPIVDRVESATIVIVPDDNLELPFSSQKIVGMSRGSRNDPLKLPIPPRQQEPLVFRSDIPTDPAKHSITFRSDVIVHNQEVFASSKTMVHVLEPKDQIEQTINLNVKFEPLNQITLLVPKRVNDNGTLKIYFDDKLLPETARLAFAETVEGTDKVQRHITLPSPLLGTGVLSLKHSYDFPEIEREGTRRIEVSLTIPSNNVKYVEQTVVCVAPNGVKVMSNRPSDTGEFVGSSQLSVDSGEFVDSDQWAADSFRTKAGKERSALTEESVDVKNQKLPTDSSHSPLPTPHSSLPHKWMKLERNNALQLGGDLDAVETVFESRQWEPSITFYVHLDYVDILGTTVVERGLIQTWLTDQMRVDHAMFRIKSDHEKISIVFPSTLDRGRLAVLLDEKPVPVHFDNGAVVIFQTPEQRSKVHFLDVKCQYLQPPESLLGNRSFELPYFDENVWVQRMYWQVIMPQNRHLIGGARDWAPEMRWNWSQWLETRLWGTHSTEPLQDELRLWIGASGKQDLKVPSETSRYLFSSFNPPKVSTLSIVDRSHLILVSSGTVLVLGWVFIYFPRVRVPGVFFMLAVLLMSVLLYKPATTMLVLQASVLGVFLTLISATLAKIVFRNSQWKSPLPYMPPLPAMESPSFSHSSEPQEVIFDSTGHNKTSLGKTET